MSQPHQPIIHYLFEHRLHDEAFCERWVVGWREWRDYIEEQSYDLEWAAQVTDLEVEQLEMLARTIAEADGCMIFLRIRLQPSGSGISGPARYL